MRVELTWTETSHRGAVVEVERVPNGQQLADLIEDCDDSYEIDGGFDTESFFARRLPDV